MSTNYFWIKLPTLEDAGDKPCLKCATSTCNPENHIGKACGSTCGRLKFLWAQKPNIVFEYCEKHYHNKVVVNEYLREYTGAEFIKMIHEQIDEENEEFIGVWFY